MLVLGKVKILKDLGILATKTTTLYTALKLWRFNVQDNQNAGTPFQELKCFFGIFKQKIKNNNNNVVSDTNLQDLNTSQGLFEFLIASQS